jgi:hypothetical protein
MRQYARISEEGRNSRRTIADAVEALREVVDFKEHDRAEIRIGLIRLPSNQIVGLVNLEFITSFREKVFVVSLPSSAQFRAMRQGSSQHDYFEISQLDGAVVDGASNVLLANL